jgi:hypothetical protein
MSNYIFTAAAAAITDLTLDLSSGSYYAHLVTVVPPLASLTVANLTLPNSSEYAPISLTGLSYSVLRWTFNDFSFPKDSFATLAPLGLVFCKQFGANPAPTDQVICYSDFTNQAGAVVTASLGIYLINIAIGINGVIDFS